MNFSKSSATAQAEGPLRLRHLILTCFAHKQEGSTTPPEAKCVQVEPWSLSEVACCSTLTAMSWVQDLTSDALSGDRDASQALPLAVEHFLRVTRRAQPR